MKMCWTTLMVDDLEKSLEFYEKLVELELSKRYTTPTGAEICFLSDGGGSTVELIFDPKVKISNRGTGVTLGFEVKSLDEMMKTVAEKGIKIDRGPIVTPSGLKFFYVLDPSGVEVQFVEK